MVDDSLHARCGPRGTLDRAAFRPSIHMTFQRHLAVGDQNRDSVGLNFGCAFQCIFDAFLHIETGNTRLPADLPGHAARRSEP